eukprot:SAG31_NODE_17345_length_674_cov_1.118261_1_plen_52_part_01
MRTGMLFDFAHNTMGDQKCRLIGMCRSPDGQIVVGAFQVIGDGGGDGGYRFA